MKRGVFGVERGDFPANSGIFLKKTRDFRGKGGILDRKSVV